jgi:hypothetical protein
LGNAHPTEHLFDHNPAYVWSLPLNIGNAEFTQLPDDRLFDNAGLGSITAQYISVPFPKMFFSILNATDKCRFDITMVMQNLISFFIHNAGVYSQLFPKLTGIDFELSQDGKNFLAGHSIVELLFLPMARKDG